jgi:hypothetical protein
VRVTRYAGNAVTAAVAWERMVDLGKVGEPVVVADTRVTVVAGVAGGAAMLAILATADGAVVDAPRAIVDKDAVHLQLARTGATTIAYVLMKDGSAQTVAINAGTSTSGIPARYVRMTMSAKATAGDGEATAGAFKAAWDGEDLVVRGGGLPATKLVEGDRFRMHQVTLHASKKRAVATVNHSNAAGSQVIIVGAAGVVRIPLVGLGPTVHSGYANRVTAFVDGDDLVVQGIESAGTYICTVSLVTDRQRACVTHLPKTAVVIPGPATKLPKPLPPSQPIGPQSAGPVCIRLGNPDQNFTIKRVNKDTISGTVVALSATCKPKLGGGIVGDRIEIEVWDGGDKPGAPACTCTFQFRQAIRPESKTAIAKVRGGKEIGRMPIP